MNKYTQTGQIKKLRYTFKDKEDFNRGLNHIYITLKKLNNDIEKNFNNKSNPIIVIIIPPKMLISIILD